MFLVKTAFGASAARCLGLAVLLGAQFMAPPAWSASWTDTSIAVQSGDFTAEFDLIPQQNGMDGVTALSSRTITDYSDAQMLLRFNPSGRIDVRNGNRYDASTAVSYSANQAFHMRLVANLSKKTYSVYVTPQGGSEVLLAKEFSFRSDAPVASSISHLGMITAVGDQRLTYFKIMDPSSGSNSNSGFALADTDQTWRNKSFSAQATAFLAEFDLVPLANHMDGVTALSSGALNSYAAGQILIRFNPSGLIDARNGGSYSANASVPYYATNTYHFRVLANVPSKSYSVYVTPEGKSETLLAKDFSFRSDAPSAASISNLAAIAPVGSHSVLNFKVAAVELPSNPTPTPVPSNSTPVDGSVSFASDWASNASTGGWRGRQTVSSDRIRVDGTKTSHGFTAARVQVSPGDDPINASGERSEVLQMPMTENTNSGVQYYALSYKFPSNWQSTASSNTAVDWSIIFQLHGPDSLGTSPVFAMNALQNGYSVTLFGGEIGNGAREIEYGLSGSMPKDKWTDFVIRIDYKASATGRVTIWRRDEGQSGFTLAFDKTNVATLQYRGSVGEHYWKQGLYRGQNKGLTNVLYMGPLARATTFEAAEAKAFGTRNGPP